MARATKLLCVLARFSVSGASGRIMAGNTLKRGLKFYPAGLVWWKIVPGRGNAPIRKTRDTADFTMPQERVGQRRKAQPRARKAPGGAEGRFSLRKRLAERPWNFLNRDILPGPSVLCSSALSCFQEKCHIAVLAHANARLHKSPRGT